jgi:hypothetical protein
LRLTCRFDFFIHSSIPFVVVVVVVVLASPLARLALGSPEQFRFLNMSQCTTVDGIDDVKEYKEMRHAMDTLQFSQVWGLGC